MRYFSPWALSVPTWPSASTQHGRVEGVDAGVDLGDGALLVGGVLLLDDALDAAVGVAQDPAVAGAGRRGGR